MTRRTTLVISLLAIAGAAAWLFHATLEPRPGETAPPKTLRSESNLLVIARDRGSVDLSVPSGRPKIVHFWATWCAPCVEELPALARFWERQRSRGNVDLFAVAVDAEGFAIVDPFLHSKGIALTAFCDPGGKTAARLGTTVFPETYFVSPGGRVVGKVEGVVDWADPEMADYVERLARSRG